MKRTPLLLIALLLAGCSSIETNVDYDRTANFSSYKTFAFKDVRTPDSPISMRRVQAAIEKTLASRGFAKVEVREADSQTMEATRLDPDHPWVRWAADSVASTTGGRPAILPNLGGSLPNDCFADALGLPTIWVPHSYPACSQHAPNEHMLARIAREGLQIMTGLFWDMGDKPPKFH